MSDHNTCHRCGASMAVGPAELGSVRFECQAESLRDYFAAAALTGICVSDKFVRRPDVPEVLEGQAMWAYEIADAMLEARGKK